jgi:hypothetical protein
MRAIWSSEALLNNSMMRLAEKYRVVCRAEAPDLEEQRGQPKGRPAPTEMISDRSPCSRQLSRTVPWRELTPPRSGAFMPVPKSLSDFDGSTGSTAQMRRSAAVRPRSIRCPAQHLRHVTGSAELPACE